uniref:Uncharacterized protein n=1 Tax=Rhizophora mucronata TaxID=61149 RepID=A0A2P2KCT8_RHIMU
MTSPFIRELNITASGEKPSFNNFPRTEKPNFTWFKWQKQFIKMLRLYTSCAIPKHSSRLDKETTLPYCFILTISPNSLLKPTLDGHKGRT